MYILNIITVVSVLYLSFNIYNYFRSIKKNTHDKHTNHINKLLRQTARWTIAARQDENPMIAVLHANYGAGYLWALKDIATSSEILAATNVDISIVEKEVILTQDSATKKMASVCPAYAPPPSLLSKIAGEG